MGLLRRVKRVELRKAPMHTVETQQSILDAFTEVFTVVKGRPPTDAEIEAERRNLAQPVRKITPGELRGIVSEVERMVYEET